MKKIEQIIYVAMDGEAFSSEEECLVHEKESMVPVGVILLDENFERIMNSEDIDTCYYAFLPTEKDVEWFRKTNEKYVIKAIGIVAGEHLWYDDDKDVWCSYEQTIRVAQEGLRKFDKSIKS